MLLIILPLKLIYFSLCSVYFVYFDYTLIFNSLPVIVLVARIKYLVKNFFSFQIKWSVFFLLVELISVVPVFFFSHILISNRYEFYNFFHHHWIDIWRINTGRVLERVSLFLNISIKDIHTKLWEIVIFVYIECMSSTHIYL